MYHISTELWKHEWAFGRMRNVVKIQAVVPQLF